MARTGSLQDSEAGSLWGLMVPASLRCGGGRAIEAHETKQLGLVGPVSAAMLEHARKPMRGAPIGIGKYIARASLRALERLVQSSLVHTSAEDTRSFLEKRPARFTGR